MMLIKFVFIPITILTGLVAGLFYAYSCSVSPGLAKLPDIEYLRAMQSINRAILNPWFFTSFFGALLAFPIGAWLGYGNVDQTIFHVLVLSMLIYVFGVFGVTIFGNVPLNEALDKVDLNSISMERAKEQRKNFESLWNKLNLIRTIASMASFSLMAYVLIQAKP